MRERIIPMLGYQDSGRAADWLANAFGFDALGEQRYRAADLEGHRWMSVQAD